MENTATLASKIALIEEELDKKYNTEFLPRENSLDFSSSDWAAEMEQLIIDYRKAIEPEVEYIRKMVMAALQENDFKNMAEVESLIKETKHLKDHISPLITDNDSLLFSLALLVMQDLQPDARDSMLYFAEILKDAKANKLDSRAALEKLLPYTSTEIQFGEYSMRVLFQQAIEQHRSSENVK